jgi:hypothetical protein
MNLTLQGYFSRTLRMPRVATGKEFVRLLQQRSFGYDLWQVSENEPESLQDFENYIDAVKRLCLSGPKVLNGIAPTQAGVDKLTGTDFFSTPIWKVYDEMARAETKQLFDTMDRVYRASSLTTVATGEPASSWEELRQQAISAGTARGVGDLVDTELFHHIEYKGDQPYLTIQRNKRRPTPPHEADKYFLLPLSDINKLE